MVARGEEPLEIEADDFPLPRKTAAEQLRLKAETRNLDAALGAAEEGSLLKVARQEVEGWKDTLVANVPKRPGNAA